MKRSSRLDAQSNSVGPILLLIIAYYTSLIMITIIRHSIINIFQTEPFPAVKFAVGYEKNIMSFFVKSFFFNVFNLFIIKKKKKIDWALSMFLKRFYEIFPLHVY